MHSEALAAGTLLHTYTEEYLTARYLGNVKEIYFEYNKSNDYQNFSRTETESYSPNSPNSISDLLIKQR